MSSVPPAPATSSCLPRSAPCSVRRSILSAFLYTLLAGGGLAILIAARRHRLHQTLAGTAGLVTGTGTTAAIEHPLANNRFAYAPAIFVGTLLAALGL